MDGADEHGVLITNGQFTAYGSQSNVESTQVVINKTNTGTVHFSNSAFWGPSDHIARVRIPDNYCRSYFIAASCYNS